MFEVEFVIWCVGITILMTDPLAVDKVKFVVTMLEYNVWVLSIGRIKYRECVHSLFSVNCVLMRIHEENIGKCIGLVE